MGRGAGDRECGGEDSVQGHLGVKYLIYNLRLNWNQKGASAVKSYRLTWLS